MGGLLEEIVISYSWLCVKIHVLGIRQVYLEISSQTFTKAGRFNYVSFNNNNNIKLRLLRSFINKQQKPS